MNGRAIPGAYLFRLYVCDKEMSWHHIGETHQPDWVVYVRDSEKFRLTNVILERIIFVSRGITVRGSARTGDDRSILTLRNKWPLLVIGRSGANMLATFLPNGASRHNDTTAL
jgi:hypothetical protein